MRYVFTLIALAATTTAAAATLSATGDSCPGPWEFTASGLTDGGQYAMLYSNLGEGSNVIPVGPCAGTPSGLAGLRWGFTSTADDSGAATLNPEVPEGACGLTFQVLDVSTCTLSNVETFSGDGGAAGCWVLDDQDYTSFYGSEPELYTGDEGTYYGGNWSGRAIDESGYNYEIADMPAGDYYVWVHAFDHEDGGWTDKSYGQWDDSGTYDDTDADVVWFSYDDFGWLRSDVFTLDAGTHTWSIGSRADGNYYTVSWDQMVVTTDETLDLAALGIVDDSVCPGAGIHNTIDWSYDGINSAPAGCSYGELQNTYEYLDLGSLTWNECAIAASERGAMHGPDNAYNGDGWFGYRTDADGMIGGWASMTTAGVDEAQRCVLARDPYSDRNTDVLSETVEYDGLTWHYQDLGVLFYDECATAAGNAGATIIPPVSLGLPQSGAYWIKSVHGCNVYGYIDEYGSLLHNNYGWGAQSSAQSCMIGHVE